MANEIEQLAEQHSMTVEFVTWFFNEKKAGCGNVWFMMMAAMWEGWKGRETESTAALATIEKCREIVGCPAGVDLQDHLRQLVAENVGLKSAITDHSQSVHFCEVCGKDDPCSTDDVCYALRETPATDRIVAGIKSEAKSHDLNDFISHYSAELDTHIANGGDQFDDRAVRLRGVIVGARMFREKLRDEEKALALREGAK